MARPLRIEYPGAFYHVTLRGNEEKDVCKSHKNRERFSHMWNRQSCGMERLCIPGPDARPLAPAAGNTFGQPCADYEAHQG
jgi:hypothetical protein